MIDDNDYGQIRAALQQLAKAIARTPGIDGDAFSRELGSFIPGVPKGMAANLCRAMAYSARTGHATDPAQQFKPGDEF